MNHKIISLTEKTRLPTQKKKKKKTLKEYKLYDFFYTTF